MVVEERKEKEIYLLKYHYCSCCQAPLDVEVERVTPTPQLWKSWGVDPEELFENGFYFDESPAQQWVGQCYHERGEALAASPQGLREVVNDLLQTFFDEEE